MNWTTLTNSIAELIVLLLFTIIMLTIIYRINLWLLKISKSDFVLNEASAIYISAVFISFAIVLNATFLTLNSYLGMLGIDQQLVITNSDFYLVLGKLLLLALAVFFTLFFISIFLFTRLTVDLNEFRDILNNNRRSAILLAGLLIAIFYAFSNNIDIILSSVFINTNNATIF